MMNLLMRNHCQSTNASTFDYLTPNFTPSFGQSLKMVNLLEHLFYGTKHLPLMDGVEKINLQWNKH